jgi:serine/threonine-protein kinase
MASFRPPRALDPSIDRALEAVCLKAMALKPEDRYASPRALAEDIERWMADEPVTARPEPWAERARRWMRRRRTAVTAAAAALVVATIGLASVLAVQARANGKLKEAYGQIQARFDLALEVIKTFHTGVSEDVLLKNDNLKPVRDRLLKDAAGFYQRLGEKLSGQADRGSRRALGQAYTEMAKLAGQIGATELAIAGHRQALAVHRGLAEGTEADGEAKDEVGRSLIELGNLLKQTGQIEAAGASYAEAQTLLEGLICSNPATAQFQRDLAASHNNVGSLLSETGKPGEALASYQAARVIRQSLAEANPAVTQVPFDLANTHLETGDVFRLTGQPAEARASYEGALAIVERVIKAQPAFANYSQIFSVSGLKGLGATQQNAGQVADAVTSWRRAVASDEWARSSHGETLYYLAGCHARLGGIAGTAGSGLSAADGAAELDRAMVVLSRAVAAGSRNVTWMKRDPDLDSLRPRSDFQLLMMDLAMPSDPFAP